MTSWAWKCTTTSNLQELELRLETLTLTTTQLIDNFYREKLHLQVVYKLWDWRDSSCSFHYIILTLYYLFWRCMTNFIIISKLKNSTSLNLFLTGQSKWDSEYNGCVTFNARISNGLVLVEGEKMEIMICSRIFLMADLWIKTSKNIPITLWTFFNKIRDYILFVSHNIARVDEKPFYSSLCQEPHSHGHQRFLSF